MTQDLLWRHLQDLPYFRATLRAVEARLMREVELKPPVLDLGCGDGHFASATFSTPVDVGVDPSFPALLEAKARRAYRGLVQADGARLPFASEAYASAFSNSVLEHIPSLEQVLVEIARVLRPGATFAFSVPNPGYEKELSMPKLLGRLRLTGLGRAYRAWFIWITRTINLLDESAWGERLKRAGFEIIRARRYFSPAALRMLEWGHYFGVPSVLARGISGRWLFVPSRWNVWPTQRIVRRYFDEAPSSDGTYTFFEAKKQ